MSRWLPAPSPPREARWHGAVKTFDGQVGETEPEWTYNPDNQGPRSFAAQPQQSGQAAMNGQSSDDAGDPGVCLAEVDISNPVPLLDMSQASAPRGTRDTRSPGSGRLSPSVRGGAGSGALALAVEPTVSNGNTGDDVHTVLMRLSDEFPIIYHMQRINTGFYRLEGHGTFELSLARNSDKLLVKLDGWNRGVRGELIKFLQAAKAVPEPYVDHTPSERSLGQSRGGFAPQERGGPAKPGPTTSQSRSAKLVEQGAVRKAAARKPLPKGGAAPKSGSKLGLGGPTPRRNGAEAGALRWREGALYVHSREPLMGDPLVAVRIADEADGLRVVARVLCSGRLTEVRGPSLQPLEVRPGRASSSIAALASFEELFFVGEAEVATRSFGRVELGELTARELANCLEDCWPPEQPSPARGLIWALRPYFIDWLQRRQRLRLFTNLVTSLPDASLRRFSVEGAESSALQSLLDLTERDLLVATLISTPLDSRSRLYAFAAENELPLPLAFSGLRCPCPPTELDQVDGADAAASQVDRGVTVHWEAFEALLALPCDRGLLLSLGGPGCAQAGKSSLLAELLGISCAVVDRIPPADAAPSARLGQCRSPAHSPGVDLLQCAAPLSWAVDVHGCSLGDPTWTALIATFAASSALTLLHVSAEDFVVQEEEKPAAPKRPTDPRGSGGLQSSRRASASKESVSSVTSAPGPRVLAKPDLMALLKILTDARLAGVGPDRARILVIHRDATTSTATQGMHSCLEAALGGSLAGIVPVEKLQKLTAAHRQRPLVRLRDKLQQELYLLKEGPKDCPQLPCIETLKQIFSHFYDRLTLAGDRPVLPSDTLMAQSYRCQVLSTLLDDAEAKSKGRLREAAFPASEASLQLAKLREAERRLLEADSGESANDAQIAELAGKLRQLEKSRRELFAEGMSPPVRFFMEVVLSEKGLSHATVAELGQCLAAWRSPRTAPLVARRRELLERRLELHQEMRGETEGPHKREILSITQRLHETEQALEQLNVTLDTFWEEVAAISDLSTEMRGLGLRSPGDLPEPSTLKRLFGDWAWHLNFPVQLLFGSPLQCAGAFLVEVLKDLGAQYSRELFVISVIGIQSSAKSTLMNFLFGCGFATSAGRCTRGLYCSLMECEQRTLLILDTEGLMSLEAEGGGIFDAQLALMAMACSHLVIINHKGELSRQLQDLLEVCLFAMQHLKVCRIQPKLLFVLRDQHDRSHAVHGDALRLMRKHLSEASSHLSLRLDELISLDPGSVFLLPSAFASDLEPHTGREVRWSTALFAQEALRLRRKIFREADSLLSSGPAHGAAEQAAPEFSTLPDWCLHAMSVWRVLDRYGPNLLHYKTIQEIELQREIEETAKQISSKLVRGQGGLSEQCQALLANSTKRLSEGESGDRVDGEFRSSLQALLESCDKKAKAELERTLQSRRSKLPEAQKEEAKKKLTTPIEYQGELTRYTWSLCLADAVDRDQLRALKVHFKTTIEQLWEAEASQSIAEEQARAMFEREWTAFEEDCKGRFARTAKSKKQLAEEVCMVFNHVLRQHRHGDQSLHILELVPAAAVLNAPDFDWSAERMAREFLEVRQPTRLREYAATLRAEKGRPAAVSRSSSDFELLCLCVVPELKKRLGPVLTMELPDSSASVPAEEAILEAIQKLNDAIEVEESRFLAHLGVRCRGGRVSLINALQLSLRQGVLQSLQAAEGARGAHQWRVLQSHRQQTQSEFIEMVQRRTSDAGRARMLAELFFDALAREWLDESLLAVAADIRGQCLADMPDASGAAERAYQQAFVERNWEDVIEYVLDVNAYLHKIFSSLFEDRKVAILRVQRPQIAAQLGSFFDALTGAANRFGGQKGGRKTKLSALQSFLQTLAAEARASGHPDGKAWPLLSERFPVVADFDIADAAHFAHEFGLHLASLLGEARVETWVAQKLESALHLQQTQVWNLIKGCGAVCPCCGSKCDRVDAHTAHRCGHHLLPAFNGWRVAGTCEAALDACKSAKNHEAPKRSDYSDHLFPNLQEYLQSEHPDWLPFPKEDRELLADSVLKAAWVNCRTPLLARYDMVDSTPAEWIEAYEEPNRKLAMGTVEKAEARLAPFGYKPETGA